jgi:hypothetical protein
MGNTKVEQGTCISLNLDAAFVEFLGTLDITFFELLGTLFKALHGLSLCGIRSPWNGVSWKWPNLGGTNCEAQKRTKL